MSTIKQSERVIIAFLYEPLQKKTSTRANTENETADQHVPPNMMNLHGAVENDDPSKEHTL